MAYEISWYVKERVIRCRQWDIFTLNEFHKMMRQLLEILKNRHEPVHLILDSCEVTHFPRNFWTLLRVVVPFRNLQGLGWVIMITNQDEIHFFGRLAAGVARKPYSSARSYGQVHQVLLKLDASLSRSLPRHD